MSRETEATEQNLRVRVRWRIHDPETGPGHAPGQQRTEWLELPPEYRYASIHRRAGWISDHLNTREGATRIWWEWDALG